MTLSLPIFLDNHSTTPVDPRVLEAMLPYFTERFGNAASRSHSFGWLAEKAVERGREQIAALIGADPREIVFTSGATESNNLAIKGVAWMHHPRGNHLITAATEHHAVLDPLKRLQRDRFEVTVLPVDRYGRVDPAGVQDAITDRTILISVMVANNEVGTLQPIARIAGLARERGILFHCDAAQAVGRIPVDVHGLGVDLASLSAHKLYGPKGVGALFVRRGQPLVRLAPLLDGGGHERGLRSGTLPVPLIVGFGEACRICMGEMPREAARIEALRERLREGLFSGLPEVTLNGHPTQRLPGNLNVSFAGVESDALVTRVGDVAVSSGSACTSASVEPSHVLRAMGVPEELAHASIRFGLGRFTTDEEIDHAVRTFVEQVTQLRRIRAAPDRTPSSARQVEAG
ncbi:MAG: IscS subfamily cysteine desulfurase [Candidatus Riflebacteria bacterium]|nr:IscS subfamily cysteine desulfurase [Candidatus Riflebacteria bacterium]